MYYWPTIFQDSFKIAQECDKCSRFVGKRRQVVMLLKPVIVEKPFQQYGMDLISVINSNSSIGHKFILTATNYFTRWSKPIPCKNAYQKAVIEIIKRIITCFGIPHTFISNNGSIFIRGDLSKFVIEYGIYWLFSSNYYPQGNGLVESTNKNLTRIIKKNN